MANEKAYPNYLMHYRTKGSRNGISTTKGYTAVGEKAKGSYVYVGGKYVYTPYATSKPTSNKGDGAQRLLLKARAEKLSKKPFINAAYPHALPYYILQAQNNKQTFDEHYNIHGDHVKIKKSGKSTGTKIKRDEKRNKYEKIHGTGESQYAQRLKTEALRRRRAELLDATVKAKAESHKRNSKSDIQNAISDYASDVKSTINAIKAKIRRKKVGNHQSTSSFVTGAKKKRIKKLIMSLFGLKSK